MNGMNTVVVTRISNGAPVHISEVISRVMPKYVERQGPGSERSHDGTTNIAAATNATSTIEFSSSVKEVETA